MNNKTPATTISREEKFHAADCLLKTAWGIYLELYGNDDGAAVDALLGRLEDITASDSK